MKILVSHPTGNRNLREVISALDDQGLLERFITTFSVRPTHPVLSLLGANMRRELKRRSYPVSADLISNRPLLELSRLLLPKFGFHSAVKHEKGFASVDHVYTDMDRFAASYLKKVSAQGNVKKVYAYEDGALNTFKMAKSLGVSCVYDLPIGYWRSSKRLLGKEPERWPEWVPTLTGLHDSEHKLTKKDQELSLADEVFVASTFTANTLNEYPGTLPKINIIPYGFPDVVTNRSFKQPGKKPLSLLFVGRLTQRKGIANLFEAVKRIGSAVQLTVVGSKTVGVCEALDRNLKSHTWIPSLPHNEILSLMRQHDVLVFPSLFEGFGMVITEAMSQGMPVITTERTAGPDLINHGRDGWIIEAGSTDALQKQIEELLDRPEWVPAAGREAIITAAARPWRRYGQELVQALTAKSNDGEYGI